MHESMSQKGRITHGRRTINLPIEKDPVTECQRGRPPKYACSVVRVKSGHGNDEGRGRSSDMYMWKLG